MSYRPPPPVDPRSYADFVEQTESLLGRYAGWIPPEVDPAAALVRVFARMAERVAERLNRAPDRAFLAFLNLVGVEPLPPQAARVPLTFSLAAGAGADAVVPARTPVAGPPLEGETEPVVFETERELVVTRTTLDAVVVHEPAHDRWADRTADAAAGTAFEAFTGHTRVPHRLHLSHRHALGAEAPKTVRLKIAAGADAPPWPEMVTWSWRNAAGEQEEATAVTTPPAPGGTSWEVTFDDLPAVPLSRVDGTEGAWISALLTPPMLRSGAAPQAVAVDGIRRSSEGTVFPFGETQAAGAFQLCIPAEIFVPGAEVTLEVELDRAHPPPAPDDALALQWEYRDGLVWKPLAVTDATDRFTRGGTVAFRVPHAWAKSTWAGHEGRWLQARIAAGGYGGGAGFRPPAVRRLELGYVLTVPPVQSIEAQLELVREELLPAAGAHGTVPLDLTTDFLPFGGRPGLGGVFYLALPQLRGRAGAIATLWFTLNPFERPAPAGYNPPTLVWEFHDAAGRRWEPFGLSGGSSSPPLGYGFDDATLSFTVAGGPHAVTFLAPDLGEVEVNGRRDAWIRVRIAGGDYGQDTTYVQALDRGVTVYRPVPPTYRPPSVHALLLEYEYTSPWTAPDAAIAENGWTFSRLDGTDGAPAPFSASADRRPTLNLGFRRAGDAVGFANRAVTLYLGVAETPFGGSGTRPLEPAALAWWYWNGNGWSRLGVADETAVLTRRGMVTFAGPPDFGASSHFGREAFWLRVTVERGGWPSPPRLERVLLNTVWAEHAARVAGEVLGSGTGRPGQRVRTLRAPVLPGERIEVREPEPPSPADAAGTWVRWTPVPDFHGSGPGSRHYVIDRLTGEIGFGDGVRGRVPPPGRANLRAAFYRTGGGTAGNRPAGTLTQLKTTVPYVDRVGNAEPAAGGAAAESLEAVRVRGPRTLRHRGRAVTVADLEDLAMEASPEVAVARAVPPAGEDEAGQVRVVVVPRSAAARPVPSLELLDRVEAYLAERLPATVQLEVLGPEWVAVAVTAEVVPVSLAAAAEVQAELPARLAAFLHPLTGGPRREGWPFGRRPYRSDLYAVVEETPGVDHVTRLELRESIVPRTPFFLVHSGAHTVWVAGSTDD